MESRAHRLLSSFYYSNVVAAILGGTRSYMLFTTSPIYQWFYTFYNFVPHGELCVTVPRRVGGDFTPSPHRSSRSDNPPRCVNVQNVLFQHQMNFHICDHVAAEY